MILKFSQRKIKKGYRASRGYFPSVKNNRVLGYESQLESEHFLLLEFDDTVSSYHEQPRIEIQVDGKIRKYDADCYINRVEFSKKRNAIIEVKYRKEIKKEEEYYNKKFQAAKESADKLDLDFILYTDGKTSEKYLFNLNFLYRYLKDGRIRDYDAKIIEELKNSSQSAGELAKKISIDYKEYMRVSNAIWGMVAVKLLSTDLHTSKINMDSIIEVNNGNS